MKAQTINSDFLKTRATLLVVAGVLIAIVCGVIIFREAFAAEPNAAELTDLKSIAGTARAWSQGVHLSVESVVLFFK